MSSNDARTPRAVPVRRLVVVAATVVAVGAGVMAAASFGAGADIPASTPAATCGPGAKPETSIQGRVPRSDYDSGRVLQGYECNTSQVARQGKSGGFKVLRYTDAQGNTCAFYDSTLLVGRDILTNLGSGLGVITLDMKDPANPRKTAALATPGMLSPHESVLLNQERGLLVGVTGTALTLPGIMDVYDVKTDCRRPRLLSTTPFGVLGHESGFSPDGKTFYSTSTAASFVAIDLTKPKLPKLIFTQLGVQYHGLRLSDDGRTMYVANVGSPGLGGIAGGGLRILDVSAIQDRKPGPKVAVLSSLTWPEVSIPQVAEPFSRNGHQYVLEVDEYIDIFSFKGFTNPTASPVGAARIINVDDPRHPRVVSNIRLAAHQLEARAGEQKNDPGNQSPAQGYAGHYCSMPTRDSPKIAGCSMILSGLRLFDIRDVTKPKEVGYFNRPVKPGSKAVLIPPAQGAYAMSQPAWDVARRSVWYSDANSGLYVVKLTNGIDKLLAP
ncbi:MAG: hypothetical protein ACR2FE_01410 [Aeromicrobium sp.]